jgi:hypothetical protein
MTPSDGNLAFTCIPSPPIEITPVTQQILKSSDQGEHWSQVGDLPTKQGGYCSIIVDATQPQTLLATVSWYNPGASPLDQNALNFASADGGRSWRSIGSGEEYTQVITYGGAIYALRAGSGGVDAPAHLVVSHDTMRSWEDIDAAISTPNQGLRAFWLNPNTGSILVHTTTGSGRGLWQTSDGGAHWSALADPGINPVQIVVQPSNGDVPWHLCVAMQDLAAPISSFNHLTCTSDGGKTWQKRPAMDITLTCNCLKGRPFTSVSAMNLAAFLPDSSVLITVNDRPEQSSADTNLFGLYRLPPGGDQWQPMGRDPDNISCFYQMSGNLIWAVYGSGGNQTDGASYTGEAEGAYIATYP